VLVLNEDFDPASQNQESAGPVIASFKQNVAATVTPDRRVFEEIMEVLVR
jgi:hypothetical protein